MSARETIFSILKEIIQTALISLGIFFFVYVFLVQPHRVKGDSMLPNFHDGELLLTEKISYHLYQPKRGDVIVFAAPGTRKVDYIKRIIALPHETIKIEKGIIYINDELVKEPYEIQSTEGNVTLVLGDNQYFVLGDNRAASSDSRSFGAIDKKSIKGRTFLVYWPILRSSKTTGVRLISGVNYGIPDTFQDNVR
jgi:signal peptidase I